MRNRLFASFLVILAVLLISAPAGVSADTATPTPAPSATPAVPSLTFYTPYPSQAAGLGETVSVELHLLAGGVSQPIALAMKDVPAGWISSFRGGSGSSTVINAVYLLADKESVVELRLEPPADLKAGTYTFTVNATGKDVSSSLTVELVIKEKLPDKLTFTTDLPTITGSPTTTFSYSVSLSNGGDSDLNVVLGSDSKGIFQVKFNLNGQDVTTFPIAAKSSKSLSVTASAINTLQAGTYPITITAQGGAANGSLTLAAAVTGQPDISVTTPDGLLSGNINAGSQTPVKLTVKNNGTASARKIALSVDTPSGWTVTFSPDSITELPAGQQQDVTANVQPADKTVAGDYNLTFHASPADGGAKTLDYRVTLLTSTLWGVVGIVLVAVAVGVIALAVNRFGRR